MQVLRINVVSAATNVAWKAKMAIQLAGDGPNGSSPPPYVCDTSFGSLGAIFMHKCGPGSQKSGLESQIRLKMAIL